MTKDFKKEKYWKYVEEFVNELKTADYWMNNDGKPLPEWKLFETRDAAADAAWNAAKNVARDTAWDAAWNAAWNAARDAAKNATRNAAWNVTGDAAWNAAWDATENTAENATRDAAGDAALFARMLVCIDLNVNIKHLTHVNNRMKVWRKGYGLYCDIKGILYVYKKI